MDQQKRAFLRGAVGFAEDEARQPYQLAFPPGESGASYGQMQNDMSANEGARKAFYRILQHTKDQTGLDEDEMIKATMLASTPGMTQTNFKAGLPGDTLNKVGLALQSSPDAVRAQDDVSAARVYDQVGRAIAGAGNRGELAGDDPNMRLIAKMGAWANRAGNLDQTRAFLANAPQVTEAAYDDFMRGLDQFNKLKNPNAEDYDAWAGRIARATEAGRQAAGIPVNGFNSENFDVTEPDWSKKPNMFNSDGYRANMLNASEEELRKAGYW